MKKQRIIAVCASASHYSKLEELRNRLKKLGYKVILPKTARKMIKSGDFETSKHKVWFKDKSAYKIKTQLIKAHLKEIEKCDAILVTNYEKNGLQGYIGGNVLIEMAAAFMGKKPIFILNPIDDELGIKEEIYGLNSIFIDGNLDLIKDGLKSR
ncbi:MAG: hypothetical protein Q7T54_05130 [Candidatus Levybacteria bacterium]|nr:hypothetical protein [Candidatus Levybacteria bacterium]